MLPLRPSRAEKPIRADAGSSPFTSGSGVSSSEEARRPTLMGASSDSVEGASNVLGICIGAMARNADPHLASVTLPQLIPRFVL